MDGIDMGCTHLSVSKVGNGPLISALAGVLASGVLKMPLSNLSLIRSGVGDKGICELCRALSSDAMRSSLECINLMGNVFTDKGLLILAQAIAPIEKLQKLMLDSCKKVSESGCSATGSRRPV